MKQIIIILLLFLFQNFAFGIVDTKKITINEAVDIASKNNLDILSSRLNIFIEENNIKSANKLQNPGAGVFYNMGNAGKGNPQQAGISQLIEIAKRNPRKEIAQANYEIALTEAMYLEFDLKMDVREAYTNLLARKSVLNTIREQEKILNKLLLQVQEKYKTKEVTQIDVLQAQLLLNQIITEVNSAKYEVKTALYEFNKVINSPDGFYDTVEDSFTADYKPLLIPDADDELPEFDDISNEAIENRYDIKIALQDIDVAEKELKNTIRKKVPDVELTGGYAYQNPGQSGDGSFKHGAFVGANLVNIPVLYNYKPEIKASELKLEQARINYSSVENKAINNLRKTYDKFILAKLTINNYNKNLIPNSEKLIQESRKNYNSGKINLTTLITMEESYKMISVAHTYALADYYNAWNAFIREVNKENFTVGSKVENL